MARELFDGKPVLDLAIVIPTLNEEGFVGGLLDSITVQSVKPAEVVVVDAQSFDGTKDQVLSRKQSLPVLKFFKIPKHTISRQRNFGVGKSKSTHILFLDADCQLRDRRVLDRYFGEVSSRGLGLACAFNLPLSDYWKDRVYFWGMNVFERLSRFVWPVVTAMNLYVRRDIFEAHRFDENVHVGEDMEFVHRVLASGVNFGFVKGCNIHTSVRRLEREGRRKFFWKLAKSWAYVLRNGFYGNPIEYEFGVWRKPR